jgi:hypothetical protein
VFDRRSLIWIGSASLLVAACAPEASLDAQDAELVDQQSRPIIGGSAASSYTEAVLVDMKRGGQVVGVCSGAMIAPRVVLTAGHCVHGFDGWRVKAPFAGGQVRQGVQGVTYDWTSDGQFVDPSQHDVGLVFLDGPIELDDYPAVAAARVPWGTEVRNVGRIDDGVTSHTALFVGPRVAVQDGARVGHPLAYHSTETIQSGDSGGPVFLAGPAPRTIVAVNSGGGGGIQVLARVDLVHAWIQAGIEAADQLPEPVAEAADPCQGLDYAGTCQGSKVIWCEDATLKAMDCAAAKKTCGWAEGKGFYDCL